MRFGSVCSGIEAASVAWEPLGWEPAWFSEIEAFPSALLAHRYPSVPNLGDMTRIRESEVFRGAAIDLLVGGTPCQAFSLAGLRGGLADPRGNLVLVFLGLVDAARPRWVVWENVPGVLSSWSGPDAPGCLEPGQQHESEETSDFGSFLAGLGELGYGWAYRVLDAQYFGVAQRRRRVFVVGCLGGWQRAAAVLFERDSLSGNPAPRREAGAGVAALTATGVGTCGADDNQAQAGHLVAHTLRGEGFDASEDGTGRGTPLVPVAFNWQGGGTQTNLGYDPDAGVTGALHVGQTPAVIENGVRRLTPRECERLQGFPDDYTLITHRGKPAADGPRYKALGNSMAVPVMAWIGRRIHMVDQLNRAEASGLAGTGANDA